MIKRLRENRVDGVTTEPRKFGDEIDVFRKFRVMFLGKDLCGSVKIASPSVIAEAFPKFQDIRLGSRGQIGDGRKTFEEAMKIRNDGRHGRLLQHHLADPDAIRIAIMAPGDVAGMAAEPREQLRMKRRVRRHVELDCEVSEDVC